MPPIGQDFQGLTSSDTRIDRRSFLAVGGAAMSATVMGIVPASGKTTARANIRYAITDRRHAESVEFGYALTRLGGVNLDVTDGITRIWQDHLLPLWRDQGGAIAGLTSFGVWACLAEQARSNARKSVLLGRHATDPVSGAVAHVITAPRLTLTAAARVEHKGRAWPRAMAVLVGQCPADTRACDGTWRSAAPFPSPSPPHSLVSWIIA